ncbi:MAG: RlmE family RNA methyltransferase [Candidatus Bathyarchaeia archaeon]
MSGRWRQERLKDEFHKLAKASGYRSRAAFKLLQINRSYGLIKPGDSVLDLGSAPGGWLQVASEIVGQAGRTVGVDIKNVEPLPTENVQVIQVDLLQQSSIDDIRRFLQKKQNAVLSDCSPNVSGVWEVDHERQAELAFRSLEIARSCLIEKGSLIVKFFDGPRLHEFLRELKKVFREVRIMKPKASKAKSAEVYIICKSFLGTVTKP